MRRALNRCLVIVAVFAFSAGAIHVSAAPNAELEALFEKLAASTTPDQHRQILDAANASPSLMAQLNDLAQTGRLTEINVVAPEAMPAIGGARFGASVDGSKFLFSSSLLRELLKNRIYDVVRANDIYPDNTVFVLGHLVRHIQTHAEMEQFDLDARRAAVERSKSTGIPDYTDALLQSVNKRLESEASAFILGWNDVVDAAMQGNGRRILGADQVGSLLMNLRYRFAFLKALKLPENSLKFSNTGMIEMDERNVKAVAAALRTSQMADIQ